MPKMYRLVNVLICRITTVQNDRALKLEIRQHFFKLFKVDDIPLPSMGDGSDGFGVLGFGGSDAEDIPLPPTMTIPKTSILKKPSSTIQK